MGKEQDMFAEMLGIKRTPPPKKTVPVEPEPEEVDFETPDIQQEMEEAMASELEPLLREKAELEEKRVELETEKTRLEAEKSALETLAEIEKIAREKGFYHCAYCLTRHRERQKEGRYQRKRHDIEEIFPNIVICLNRII